MINEQSSDAEIIQHVLQGDVNCFKWIIGRYQKHIYSIGMRFFKNENDAYDFTQDVFIKAYSKLASYLGNAPLRFWLAKIAYNHGINTIHAKNGEGRLGENSFVFARETSPENAHSREEIKEILLKAIDTLPKHYQICLDFYFFLGLSYNEISEITGFPVNTIKSNVFRAKQLLRDVLRGTIAEEYHEV